MAKPVVPTLTSITEEALKKAGHSNPTGSAILIRAQDQWMEEIKNDIYTRQKRLKSLETSAVIILEDGRGRYSLPVDYGDKLSFNLLNGSTTGIAQAATAGTITLAADEDIAQDIIGRKILVTSGTGKGSMSQCTAYDETTKIATVTPDFTTTPAALDGYMVISTHSYLVEAPVWDMDRIDNPTIQGPPTNYSLLGDSNNGEVLLYPVPYTSDDSVLGLELRYYADLQEVDLASTLMSTLYQKYRTLFLTGIVAKAYEDDDDNRAEKEFVRYQRELNELVSRETIGLNVDNLNMTIEDY